MPRSRWPLVILFVGIALLCARLGFWQVDRLQLRRQTNQALAAARRSPPLDLTTASRVTAPPEGTPVRARGTWDFAREIVVMGRVLQGTPGVYVLTPLRLAGSDHAVLVNRGFVPAPDGFSVALDSLREPPRAEVSGSVREFDPVGDRSPPTARGGRLNVGRIHYGTLRDRFPYPLLPVILRQDTAGVPPLPRRLPPEPLDDGPHLGYAIQWFGFAAIALVFAAVVWRRGGGERLRES